MLRTAPALTGPWSEPVEVFRCRDAALDPALGCYAGKEHATMLASVKVRRSK